MISEDKDKDKVETCQKIKTVGEKLRTKHIKQFF